MNEKLSACVNNNLTGLDKLIDAWLDEHYDLRHKQNSVRFHLGVDRVSDCDDPELKKRYWAYLTRGEIMQ